MGRVSLAALLLVYSSSVGSAGLSSRGEVGSEGSSQTTGPSTRAVRLLQGVNIRDSADTLYVSVRLGLVYDVCIVWCKPSVSTMTTVASSRLLSNCLPEVGLSYILVCEKLVKNVRSIILGSTFVHVAHRTCYVDCG